MQPSSHDSPAGHVRRRHDVLTGGVGELQQWNRAPLTLCSLSGGRKDPTTTPGGLAPGWPDPKATAALLN